MPNLSPVGIIRGHCDGPPQGSICCLSVCRGSVLLMSLLWCAPVVFFFFFFFFSSFFVWSMLSLCACACACESVLRLVYSSSIVAFLEEG